MDATGNRAWSGRGFCKQPWGCLSLVYEMISNASFKIILSFRASEVKCCICFIIFRILWADAVRAFPKLRHSK